MARKQPVGYVVRRPMTLWGKKREIGDIIKVEDNKRSRSRFDTLVRAGRLSEIFDETDKGLVVKGRTRQEGEVFSLDEKPKAKAKAKPKAAPKAKDKAKAAPKAKDEPKAEESTEKATRGRRWA